MLLLNSRFQPSNAVTGGLDIRNMSWYFLIRFLALLCGMMAIDESQAVKSYVTIWTDKDTNMYVLIGLLPWISNWYKYHHPCLRQNNCMYMSAETSWYVRPRLYNATEHGFKFVSPGLKVVSTPVLWNHGLQLGLSDIEIEHFRSLTST